MKKLFVFVALAALLASCVQSETLDVVDQVHKKDKPIKFDIYTPRNVATKAGVAGVFTNDSLKSTATLHGKAGFGVFAFYTDNGKYDQYCKPNYMYNQQVYYDGTNYKYEPVKYWPNEYGNTAASDDMDRVSFFAYAPYVKVTPSTGAIDVDGITDVKVIDKLQNYNITGLTNNTATGDPLVKYVVDWFPSTSVDLLWGVASDNTPVGSYSPIVNNDNTVTAGLPFKNLIKEKTGVNDKVKFNLRHALAQLNIQIDAAVDATTTSAAVDQKTMIWVRSITFQGFATKGALNLNNTEVNKPRWMDYAGNDELSVAAFTIYDGRKDGKEGYDANDGAATNEKVLGLNPEIIQPGKYTITNSGTLEASKLIAAQNVTIPGVTKTPVNLFDPDGIDLTGVSQEQQATVKSQAPIYVIPTNETLIVTIVYDVETYDTNLSGYLSDGVTHGSSIENKITQEIKVGTDPLKMQAGKAYTILLHLGMTTVKMEASVTDWDETNTTTPTNVDLPANVTND